jgi:hypothetical protein
MNIIFSKHAKEQMLRRGIRHDVVLQTFFQPDQTIIDKEDMSIIIYQSLIKENEQVFLLRVFVNKDKQPNMIVTLYKTTKILKYYES